MGQLHYDLGQGLAYDTSVNVLANLIFVVLTLLLAAALYAARGRRPLRAFFGIGHGRRSVVQAWLSNVPVKATGTVSIVPIRGTKMVSTILAGEYEYALALSNVIQSRPFVGAFYALLEQLGIRAIEPPVNCRISPSLSLWSQVRRPEDDPSSDDTQYRSVDFDTDQDLAREIERTLCSHHSSVLVGSGVYNVLTYYVLKKSGDDVRVEFCESSYEPGYAATALKIRGYLQGVDQVFERRVDHNANQGVIYEEYFLLQKMKDWRNSGSTVFICAGSSVVATAAAVYTLADYRRLLRDFGSESFAAVYKVSTVDRELATIGSDEPPNPNWKITMVWGHPEPR